MTHSPIACIIECMIDPDVVIIIYISVDLSCLFYLLRFSVIITTIRFTQHDTSMFSKKTNKQHNQVETWRSTCWSWSTSGPIRSKTGFPTLESSETAIVIIDDDDDGLSERYGTICFFMSSWDIWRWFPETLTNMTFPASSKVLKPIQSSVYSLVYTKSKQTLGHSCHLKQWLKELFSYLLWWKNGLKRPIRIISKPWGLFRYQYCIMLKLKIDTRK